MKKTLYNDFKEIKKELSSTVSSTKYFNFEFFKTYITCKKSTKNATDEEYNESLYKIDNIIVSHFWDDVYNSNFYVKNACAYCEFLSIVSNLY